MGDANVEPYIDPTIMWPQTTPPSGLTFWHNQLFLATLRSQALIRIDIIQSNDTYQVIAIDRLFSNGWSIGTYGILFSYSFVDSPTENSFLIPLM